MGAGKGLVSNAVSSTTRETIVRIRGEIVLWLSLVTAIGDGFTNIGMGIGIVSADAFAAGASAVPGPTSDITWPGWMWNFQMGPLIGLSTTESENTGQLSMVRIPIDTKAMRKISLNEVVFGMVESGVEVGTAAVDFGMRTRSLYKLA